MLLSKLLNEVVKADIRCLRCEESNTTVVALHSKVHRCPSCGERLITPGPDMLPLYGCVVDERYQTKHRLW